MHQLSEILAEIQREAADLPTGKLRTEIQVSVDVLAAFIDSFQNMRPGAVSLEDMISATGDVITAALVTALYVRELTTRPVEERRFARVKISFN